MQAIKNENIVCISDRDWENIYMNPIVELLSVINSDNNILFVDRQYTIKDIILRILKGRGIFSVNRMLGITNRLREVKTRNKYSVKVLSPWPSIPVNWVKSDGKFYRFLLKFNAFLLRKNITKALNKLNILSPIIINNWNPFTGIYLYKKFNEKLHVYFCYDEMRLMPYYKTHVGNVEDEFTRKVDGVISTSKALNENRKMFNNNNFVIENAADFKLFNKAYKIGKNNKREQKVVGYIGSIDFRFDLELMKKVIKNSPDLNYLIVGRNDYTNVINELIQYPNVEIHGPQEPELLPEFTSRFDVGVIPYLRLDVVRYMYPMKINEYLAAGKPVVMTKFADLPQYTNIVSITNDPNIFLKKIREEISTDSEEKQLQRIKFAKNNSWENRGEQLNIDIHGIKET